MKKMVLILIAALILLPAALFAGGSQEEGDIVEIEFFQRKREVVDLFDEIIAKFEAANPGIKVEQIHVSDHDQVLQSRLAANDVPDVLTHWPNKADYVQASTDGFYLDITGDSVADGALPGVIDSIKIDGGRNFAVPVSVNTQGIFYNKDLFAENNLSIPTTFDELIALCDKISAMGGQPFVFPDGTDWTLEQQLRMSLVLDMDGYKLMDDIQAGRIKTQDAPGLKKIAEKYLKLRAYAQPDTLGTSYEQACFEFATGKSFMFWQGIWAIPAIQKANPGISFSMFALPSYTVMDTRVEYGVDLALVIGNTGDAEKMEAAKKFVAFIASQETGQYYADVDGSPSALKGVEFSNEISKPLVDMVQAGKAFRNVRFRWPAGGTERSRRATQQYLVDNDLGAWLEELNYVFGHPDYK